MNFMNVKYRREILTHLEALAKAEQYQSKISGRHTSLG